jgi:hypothetical protein
MTLEEAQREVRSVFLGGFPGGIVSGLLWLVSAGLSTWTTPRNGILVLVVGGMFIFPATLLLKMMGRPTSLARENPKRGLAMQVAFTVPLSLPLVGTAALHRLDWFYPAFRIVVGAHYLPFVFLYGMWQFAVLCGVMVGGGLLLGLHAHGSLALGGWVTAAMLLVFAFVAWRIAARRST